METKPLLYGLIGFFIGGLTVSFAATTLHQGSALQHDDMSSSMQMSTQELAKKTGDDFDKAFIDEMVIHHEGAVAMAELAEKNAKHSELRQLSKEIVAAQNKEISVMQRWKEAWGYVDHTSH